MIRIIAGLILTLFAQLAMSQVTTGDIAKYLPGIWHSRAQVSDTIFVIGKTVYHRNGKMTYHIKMVSTDKKTKKTTVHDTFTGEGQWKIEGHYVVVTITKSSSSEFLKVGKILKDKVTYISAYTFSYIDQEGTAMTECRKCSMAER